MDDQPAKRARREAKAEAGTEASAPRPQPGAPSGAVGRGPASLPDHVRCSADVDPSHPSLRTWTSKSPRTAAERPRGAGRMSRRAMRAGGGAGGLRLRGAVRGGGLRVRGGAGNGALGFAYDGRRRLALPCTGVAVEECGPRCRCPPECPNRVLQRRPRRRLEVFDAGARGLGLRTLEPLARGDFVLEYAGEALDLEEAEFRALSAPAGRTYQMTVVPYDDPSAAFVIDAGARGGAARLVNHSCEPSLRTAQVHVGGTARPRVGLYALRDLARGEELTFDYDYDPERNSARVEEAAGGGGPPAAPCLCGAARCRRRVP
eukprot:tig00021569_g22350.t1